MHLSGSCAQISTELTLVLIPAVDVLLFCALGRVQHAAGPCVYVLLLGCENLPQLF
jgi:hypothetical protein